MPGRRGPIITNKMGPVVTHRFARLRSTSGLWDKSIGGKQRQGLISVVVGGGSQRRSVDGNGDTAVSNVFFVYKWESKNKEIKFCTPEWVRNLIL